MSDIIKLLQLFADGGDGGAGDAGSEGTAPAPEAESNPDEEFEELIKGKYKQQYERKFQSNFEKRAKNLRKNSEMYEKAAPILQALSIRHNVSADDIDGIAAAVEKDNSYYEDAAYAAGMTPDEYRAKLAADRETAELREFKQKAEQAEQRRAQFDAWVQQAEALKATYPDFDFSNEIRSNPAFVELLNHGLNVEAAFKTANFDRLVNGAVVQASTAAKDAVANSVKANGMRPVENGLSGQTPSANKGVDINKMTLADINSLFERAGRGEKITLT